MSRIKEAAMKAEELMDSKYGDTWKIMHTDKSGEEKIEIKPEYISEYDSYYNKFYFI